MTKAPNRMTGIQLVGVGAVICLITIVAMVLSAVLEVEPTGGRAETLIAIGLPAGIVMIVVGLAMSIIQRRKR